MDDASDKTAGGALRLIFLIKPIFLKLALFLFIRATGSTSYRNLAGRVARANALPVEDGMAFPATGLFIFP